MERISPKIDFATKYDITNLRGKGVLITGGASGLGAALVRAFAEAGAFVTFADVSDDLGKALEKEMASRQLTTKFVRADVTSFSSQVLAFKAAVLFHPHQSLDIVVPNAGVPAGREEFFSLLAPEEFPTASLDTDPIAPNLNVLNVNLIGVLYSLQLAMHYFRLPKSAEATGGKTIVFVSSLAGYTTFPGGTVYISSKHGVRGAFKAMRKYTVFEDVRVNLIAPGYMDTPMIANVVSRLQESGMRLAKCSDAVDAVLRLSAGSSINGRAVCVGADGNYDLCDDNEFLDATIESLDFDFALLTNGKKH